jgi:hypothetical protein
MNQPFISPYASSIPFWILLSVFYNTLGKMFVEIGIPGGQTKINRVIITTDFPA